MVRYFLQVYVPHFFLMLWWVILCEVISCIFFPAYRMRSNLFCFILSLIYQYRISKDLESLDRMLDVIMPCAVLLSVSKGASFAGCGYPSSIQAMCIG